tara:strand:- start:417 stop:893 length:477 start_codon:yes stop_codon:yes gene_type:complete
MNTIIIRPGNLYGPNDKFDWEKSKAIPAILRRAIEKQNPLEIWGDGSDIKDYLYIDDFIEAILLAMEKIDTFQVLNIASGKPVSLRQVIKSILELADFNEAELIFDKSKPTMIPKRIINISLAKEKLNWHPKIELSEGLRNTIDWYKQKYKYNQPEDI